MKKKAIIILCLVLLVSLSLFADSDKYKIESFSITKTVKSLADPAEPNYIKRIDISYDTNSTVLSPAYTYLENMDLFKGNWTYPEDARYDKGNNNIYFYYCPGNTPCEYEDLNNIYDNTYGYNYNVVGERVHWINIEIFGADCQRGEFCVNDFDSEHLDEIEIYVNGVKRDDAVVSGYNPYWHCVDVFYPIDVYAGSVVKKITVDRPSNSVQRGTEAIFTVDIESYGDNADGITWSVSGNTSNDTYVSNDGVLHVAADEDVGYLYVRATSTLNENVYNEKPIYVIAEPLSITSVVINSEDLTVVYGGQYAIDYTVVGTANYDVEWSMTGNNNPGTTISDNGVLTVAADETAKSVQVTVTSTFDNTKKDTIEVTFSETIMINKIEINYDPDLVIFTSKTTYNDAREVFKDNATVPEEAKYGIYSTYIAYCETDERCTNNYNFGYSINMYDDRYTYLDLEVYALPRIANYENPLYDFDKDHLDQVEVWVNGVKRDDAIVKEYSNSYRQVDVLVPITVNNGKIAQTIRFNYDSYPYVYYGDEPFKNYVSNHVGDGNITYSSSDENIATVDNDGYVTVKKIGNVTITAHMSETEDYQAGTASYTIIVRPKYIDPNVSGYNEESYYYTGSQIKPSVVVKYNDITLVENTDYTVSYDENIDTGWGYIYLNPVEGSNYTMDENITKSFYINRKDIQNEDVVIAGPVYYDGTWKQPEVTVTVDGRKLVKDTDYSLNYYSNLNVGTAYVEVRGIGNYTDTVNKSFDILEAPEVEKGDLNMDGEVGLTDVIKLLKFYLNLDEPTDLELSIGDMNDDGEIGLVDIIAIIKKYLGLS